MSYILLMCFIGCFMFCYLGGHNIIIDRYSRFRQLKQLVSSSSGNSVVTTRSNFRLKAKILWGCLVIIMKALYISFIQHMNSSIKKIGNNTYEINYVVNGRMYTMVVVPKKGPRDIIQVIDECNNDVTDIIAPYTGPNEDWHTRVFKPSFFSKKSLTFNRSNCEEITFTENEEIK